MLIEADNTLFSSQNNKLKSINNVLQELKRQFYCKKGKNKQIVSRMFHVFQLQIIKLTQTILMKVLQDTRLAAPPTIHPIYNNLSKDYQFTLQLVNNFTHPLHFYIASTFGCCLTQTTQSKVVNENSFVVLNFKLKPTNLLGKIPEKLMIFASQHESSKLFRINNCFTTSTRLVFDEENILDPTIVEILNMEVEACRKQGQELKTKGEIAKALTKFEQGYQIMRSQESIINEMISCRLQLKDYEGAMRDIECALVWQMNICLFLLKKVEVIMQWQDKNVQNKAQIYGHIEQTFEYINDNFAFYHMSPNDKDYFNHLFERFKNYSKMTQGKVNSLLTHLYQKTIHNIAPKSALLKCFQSKEQFQQQLKELLLDQKQEEITTPEQVLDPIGYQIMHKPYILPCGSSCEQQTLRNYFITNGYKDPITRQHINYEFVFKNLNLQRYIKEHPDLKKWQKYELDYLHH